MTSVVVKGVTRHGVDTVRLNEPKCRDEWHTKEDLDFLALGNDVSIPTVLEVGRGTSLKTGNGNPTEIKFATPFDVVPVVILSENSVATTDCFFKVLRIVSVEKDGFSFVVQREESASESTRTDIAWLAMKPTTAGNPHVIAGRSVTAFVHKSFEGEVVAQEAGTATIATDGKPSVFLSITNRGGNTAVARTYQRQSGSFKVIVDEDMCGDSETWHLWENVHVILVGDAPSRRRLAAANSVSTCSTFTVGDGVGGHETRLPGSYASEATCIAAVKAYEPESTTRPNGVTYGTAGGGRENECYAEYGMTSTNGNSVWKTCALPTAVEVPLLRCAGGDTPGWVRPYGNVATTVAGVESCRDKCTSGGFKYWGTECPMGNTVHCQCSNAATLGETGPAVPDAECNTNAHTPMKHCTGPFTVGPYGLGAANVGTVYATTTPATEANSVSTRPLPLVSKTQTEGYCFKHNGVTHAPGDATATDQCDGDLATTRSGGPTNGSPTGQYTETFTAVDSSSNEISCTRTIDVVPVPTHSPTHAPTLSPTTEPTFAPTADPTTAEPTESPTKAPTHHICAAESGLNPCDSVHGVCDEVTSISLDGEYDVYYRGQQRGGAIMQIKNSGSVATGYGMAAGEASKITQITDSKTECNGNDGYAIKIVRTHGTSKFECLNQMSSGDLVGLHFLGVSTSATPWGAVVYKKRDVATRRRLSSADADPMAATGQKYVPTAHVGTFKCSCDAGYECVTSAVSTLDECYTCKMTAAPTTAPTTNPTKFPTAFPTKAPTNSPTVAPTQAVPPECVLLGRPHEVTAERCSSEADALATEVDAGAYCTNAWDSAFPKTITMLTASEIKPKVRVL